MKLGAFGWATHQPRSHNTNRLAKRRPFVIIMEHAGRFAGVCGRSDERLGTRFETIGDQSHVGRRLRLTRPTHFQAELVLMPDDFEVHGFFVTHLEEMASEDTVSEFELWLRLRRLGDPA